jgi:hypothetical protein
MRAWNARHIPSVLLVVALTFVPSPVGAGDLAARSSYLGGVSVSVTPKEVAPSAATWEFSVGLNTHSQDLSDDLVKSPVLIDAQGGKHAPTAWEG